MSIKTQKKLLFLPVINFIIPFIWLSKCFHNKITMGWFLKKAVIMVIGITIVSFARVLLNYIIDNAVINTIAFYVDAYLCFLIIAKVSFDAQIELENKGDKSALQ